MQHHSIMQAELEFSSSCDLFQDETTTAFLCGISPQSSRFPGWPDVGSNGEKALQVWCGGSTNLTYDGQPLPASDVVGRRAPDRSQNGAISDRPATAIPRAVTLTPPKMTETAIDDQTTAKNDARLVGTPAMLQSPNVSAAPPRVNRPVPVPSVYKDERGEIHNICVGDQHRINVLYTRKGVMRSGDIHSNTQHDFIFSGQVELWILSISNDETITKKSIHGPGDYIQVPPYVPHVFHFLQDTVMAEWWTPGSFFAWFYHPYRKEVQNSFSCSRPGELQQLAPVPKKKFPDHLLVMAGLSVGFAAGLMVARQRK